jgi:serine/threonine-protein phosphatase 6 regulatory ankyrin repeat subunit B
MAKAIMTVAAVTFALLIGAVSIVLFTRPSGSMQLLSAAESGDLERVKSLVRQGAPLNEPSRVKFGWTPLIGAVFHNETNIVQYLVESGADVNCVDKDGLTPLMWAAGWGDRGVAVVKILITHGANLDAKDKNGATVFEHANSAPPKPELLRVLEAARSKKGDGSTLP